MGTKRNFHLREQITRFGFALFVVFLATYLRLVLNQATADFDFDRLAGENFGRPVAQLAVCSF
ncbi:MAG: hypothetical protein NXI32_19175 [bacterium]|nr:hypothetical protein [bacterium]